jgi:hypothetical protein
VRIARNDQHPWRPVGNLRAKYDSVWRADKADRASTQTRSGVWRPEARFERPMQVIGTCAILALPAVSDRADRVNLRREMPGSTISSNPWKTKLQNRQRAKRRRHARTDALRRGDGRRFQARADPLRSQEPGRMHCAVQQGSSGPRPRSVGACRRARSGEMLGIEASDNEARSENERRPWQMLTLLSSSFRVWWKGAAGPRRAT